ncbi:MAG TPA: site-2 protease family protein [Armatimonadota bacterium]|nr:site-2 protease family protein [Armatimonadota bacterium]
MGVSQETLIKVFMILPVILISVALHEFAHCWANDRLGDDTPRKLGRVTLNPLVHLDPLGTIMMVVTAFSGFGIGWGKPSPFNPANFRHPSRDRMLGAIAGPLSNIVQMLAWASLSAVARAFFGPTSLFTLLCFLGMQINAGLAVFNLIPVYPLDGHHLLSYLAPRSWRPVIDNPAWGTVFLLVIILPQTRNIIVDTIMSPLVYGLMRFACLIVG